MNKELLIKDLQEIATIIGFNRDMFKENYDRDMVDMLRGIVKNIKTDKYSKEVLKNEKNN